MFKSVHGHGFPFEPCRSCRRASHAWLDLPNFSNSIFLRLKNFSCKYEKQNENLLRIQHNSITASVKVSWTREKSSNSTRACSQYLEETFILIFFPNTRAMTYSHAGERTEVCFCLTFAFWKRFSGQSETHNKAWSASRRLTAPSCVCMWN